MSTHLVYDDPSKCRCSCLRNVVSMFHILEKEMQWRREQGKPEGFDTLRAHPPLVALGAEDPLDDQKMLADYFREFRHLHTACLVPCS